MRGAENGSKMQQYYFKRRKGKAIPVTGRGGP
jgi:hypothetical protein